MFARSSGGHVLCELNNWGCTRTAQDPGSRSALGDTGDDDKKPADRMEDDEKVVEEEIAARGMCTEPLMTPWMLAPSLRT